MKCPICKQNIPDNSLRCPHCNARTGLICKNCHTVNSIFDIICKNCGEEILKLCPNCNSVNFPNSNKCRKCGHNLTNPEKIKSIHPAKFDIKDFPTKIVPQPVAKNILIRGIESNVTKIMSLSGDKGVGKNTVYSSVKKDLKNNNNNYIWLYGKCTPITQLTPGGLIQDILLNLFNLPNFCLNSLKFKKDAVKYLQNEFEYLSNEEILDFLNFLYPTHIGNFEDLLKNKSYTFDLLNKIFDHIIQANKFIFVIDNFDNIDGFSYEFLSSFIKKENIWPILKLLLIYVEPRPAKGFFNFPEKDIYLDISIAPFNAGLMLEYVKHKEEVIVNFPKLLDSEKREIFMASKGNPEYLEQALSFKLDTWLSKRQFQVPQNYSELVKERMSILKESNKAAYKTLIGAAILGDKINLNLIKQIFDFDDKQFDNVIFYLEKANFIKSLNDIFCRFNDLMLWETVFKIAKDDEIFQDLNIQICQALEHFTLNSNAIFGILAQNLKHPELALKIWTANTRLSAYIGDTNLYAISQKQCLALINELDETETLAIRYNISERLGKLLTDFNPKEAMDYLPDAIAKAEADDNIAKEIELLGYMANCCEKTGNYFGNIECVDSVIKNIDITHDLELALLKCSKLNSLLYIGNCGEVVNIIDNDIMPVFDKYLSRPFSHKKISYAIVFESWLKTYLVLANALIMQGNDRAFEIITILFDIIDRNNIQDKDFICKCKLALAFANTIKGDVVSSEKFLEDILKSNPVDTMDRPSVIRWNLINIINIFMRNNYTGLKEELFDIVTYANNSGDMFTKNILKSLLGKILKSENKPQEALKIYQDQIAYFSKGKIAIGALLTWYLIAETTIITEGPYAAMEIAEQAIEVAQNPNISNFYFEILLRIVCINTCFATSDFETMKIHLDIALKKAENLQLIDLLSKIYMLYGKYYKELGLVRSDSQVEYLTNCAKLYTRCENLLKQTQNKEVSRELQKAKSSLKSYCQLNKIKLSS